MTASIDYLLNTASAEDIAEHLMCCDADFVPPLSSRLEIKDYAQKIANKATRFEAWSCGTLIGFVAAYFNDRDTSIAFITSVSVLKAWTGKGVAAHLMSRCIEHATASGLRQISLEVASDNRTAIRLYEKSGFVAGKANAPFVGMNLNLKSGEERDQQA